MMTKTGAVEFEDGIFSDDKLRTGVAMQLVFVNLALRYVTGTEVALVLLLQSALAPVAVFLGTGIAPTEWTVIGGAMLILTLLTHELISLKARRRGS